MASKLITRAQVKEALKIRGPFGDIAAALLISLTGLGKINKLYSKIAHHKGRDFTEALLKELNVNFEIDEKELEYIPQEGPFIITSNHPYGAIDGIILLHVVGSIRPDIKFLTNFILSHIPNLSPYFLPVNPFTENPNFAGSYGGLKRALESLKEGSPLALFPSGEVSTHYRSAHIRDKEWQPSVVKLVKNAAVPVIPLYFDGSNSKRFHWIGKIHPMLRTARLPKEMLNKRGKSIKLSIGKAITLSEMAEHKQIKDLASYLRARSYALEPNVHHSQTIPIREKVEPIALPKNRRAMQKEINLLSPSKHLFTTGNYSCYLADANSIPLVMHEVGRRREEAFRAVGEGTGRPLDIDRYDHYYKHLILWDKKNTRLAGAYRLGFGQEILKEHGVKGFYSSTLFLYEKGFESYLGNSIELGRSFVVLEYQKEALPLMLLIKGLFYAVAQNSEVKYLLGPVSISSWYPKFYRSLMIYYLQNSHSIKELEGQIIPKNPFFADYLRSDPNSLLSGKMDSIEKFDRYLLRLSNNRYRLPTLVKKYLKINCKIIAFNVDPDFNYCVDGLVFLDLMSVSKDELELLARGEKDRDRLMARFGYY